MDLIIDALKIVAFAVGTWAILFAGFAYEGEERALRDWIEGKWIQLDTIDGAFSARVHTILKAVLRQTDLILSRFYGRAIVSARALAAPVCALLGLTAGFLAIVTTKFDGSTSFPFVLYAASAIGFAAPFIRLPGVAASVAVASLLGVALLFNGAMKISEHIQQSGSDPFGTLPFFIVLILGAVLEIIVLGLIIEIVAISVTRLLIRRSENAATLRRSVLLAMLSTGLAPAAVFSVVGAVQAFRLGRIGSWDSMAVGLVAANAVGLATSLLLLIVLTGLCAARLFVALAPRTVYLGIKTKVLENRKVVFLFGVALIAWSSGTALGQMIRETAKLFSIT